MRDRFIVRFRGSYKRLREILGEQTGWKCFWCGQTVVEHDIPAEMPKGFTPPDNTATIDHLVSKHYRKKGEAVPKVLCCYKCNQKRELVERKYLWNN